MPKTAANPDISRLKELLFAQYPCINIVTHEEEDALDLVRACAAEIKQPLLTWSVSEGVRDGLIATDPVKDTEHPAAALFYLHQKVRSGIVVMLDLADHLKDEKLLRMLRDLLLMMQRHNAHLVLIDHSDKLPGVITAHANRFELSLPDEKQIEQIVRQALRSYHKQFPIEIDITRGDMRAVIRNLRGLTRRQIRQIILRSVASDRKFHTDDLNTIVVGKRQALQQSGVLEYVQAPVNLDDIGGLRRLKSWLKQRHSAITDDASKFGLASPRGVLLLGVQGAGKSLAAKAVATAWSLPLMRMDVGALYDRYIGESERRLRDSLRQAETMSPMVLWIDEIEKAFASAASRSSDGGLSQRMFGTMLTWMQEHDSPVFIVATANDIEALPPELLRKGRFDETFFVDLPGDKVRELIFKIHLKKRKRDPEKFDLQALAQASDGFSGAEIEQAVVAGLHDAYAQKQELTNEHILAAIRSSPPLSVTMAEKVDALRQWASQRCVPAD